VDLHCGIHDGTRDFIQPFSLCVLCVLGGFHFTSFGRSPL
jgi:hypothetical protein